MRIFTILLLGLALAGCVSMSETQLRQDIWQIQASGQGALARGKTANALYKRAAELAIEKGYTHFIPGAPQTSGSFRTGGFTPVRANVVGGNVFVSGGQAINIYQETRTVLVKMSRSGAGGALDATTVLASVK